MKYILQILEYTCCNAHSTEIGCQNHIHGPAYTIGSWRRSVKNNTTKPSYTPTRPSNGCLVHRRSVHLSGGQSRFMKDQTRFIPKHPGNAKVGGGNSVNEASFVDPFFQPFGSLLQTRRARVEMRQPRTSRKAGCFLSFGGPQPVQA